jgi:hypothetical protein
VELCLLPEGKTYMPDEAIGLGRIYWKSDSGCGFGNTLRPIFRDAVIRSTERYGVRS